MYTCLYLLLYVIVITCVCQHDSIKKLDDDDDDDRSSSVHEIPALQLLFGLFKKDGLWQHMRVCPLKADCTAGGTKRVQAKSSLLLPVSECASRRMRENVLETMQHDGVSLAVKNDPLIPVSYTHLTLPTNREV